MLLKSLLSSCLILGLGAASVLPRVTSSKATPGCVNGPSCRACWGDFNVATDSEEVWPKTGKTVYYSLNITNQTMSPDGTPRDMLVINGQYPGPTLVADWGDTLEIDVTNSMQDNG
jgi:FtsP/CotA-like multicopper oxidase with cupredoxin domain